MVAPEPGLILLLGQSGVGKSTFINLAADEERAHVSHDYENSTSEVSGFVVEFKSSNSSRRVMLVDTPGFNDTWKKDVEILEKIIKWLKAQDQQLKVHGILYLHDIGTYNAVEAGGGSVTPSSLSDPRLAKYVFLATKGWTGHNFPAKLVDHEKSLKEGSWNLMAEAGSKIMRFEHTYDSALKILQGITQPEPERPDLILETFIHEMETIRNRLLPKEAERNRLPINAFKGFFSSLFSR